MTLEVQTHRPKPKAKTIAVFVACAAIGMLLPLIFPLSPPQNAWHSRVNLSLIIAAMYFLPLIIWLFERWLTPRHRVVCNEDRIIWRDRRGAETILLLADVTKAIWRKGSESRLELTTPSGRHHIEFKHYDRPHRLALIRRLSDLIPTETQIGWPAFCRINALPLFQSLEESSPTDHSGRRLKRGRWDFIFGMGLLAAIAIWPITGGISVLLMLELFFPMWLLLRMNWPKEGATIPEQPPSARPHLIAVALVSIAAIPLACATRYVVKLLDNLIGTMIALMLLAFALLPLFIVSHKYRDADKAWRERMQAEAVAEWNRLTSSDL